MTLWGYLFSVWSLLDLSDLAGSTLLSQQIIPDAIM